MEHPLSHSPAWAAQMAELLADDTITVQHIAQACCLSPDWVSARVQAGVLTTSGGSASAGQPSEWRFSSTTLVRARRIAGLEQTFDADPQLAAMTVDLMEEVALLRKRLQSMLEGEGAHR